MSLLCSIYDVVLDIFMIRCVTIIYIAYHKLFLELFLLKMVNTELFLDDGLYKNVSI